MASSTSGRIIVILPGDPLRLIHIQVIFESTVENAVLGLLVNLFLWMVRAKVTLATGLRLTGLFFAETMSGMAGGTGAFGAIRIDTTDTCIRPGVGVERTILVNFDY